MSGAKIFLVEDDADIAEVLRYNLQREGFDVETFDRGDTALAGIRRRPPDLLLLDLMLPGLDGLEMCRLLKRDPRTAAIPLVMLTARGEETDRIVGLELGADDYISKPFSPREVVLRIRAVMRRASSTPEEQAGEATLEAGSVILHADAFRVEIAGHEVPMTATEFKLLQFLMARPNRVQTRDTLLTEVWGYSEGVDSRTVDTHVRRLRRKLGSEARRIETIVGIGYRFRA
jgi:two-component system, OmpR family, phosphate regulon response regulator PhoB